MGSDTPLIRVNRVVVTGGYTLDLHLTSGLNIIYGDNGSGKSTFCNLIAYALGGKVKNFPDEIAYCHSVFVELTLNNKAITLERYLNDSRAPVNLYPSDYPPNVNPDEVKVNDLSDRLLGYLGYPKIEIPLVKNGGKLTIARLTFLRLFNWMYFDQDTSAQHLIRNGNYVDVATRKAVTDFFLGVLDVGIFALEKELAGKKGEKQRLASRIKAVEDFLNAGARVVTPDMMLQLSESLEQLQRERAELLASQASKSDVVQELRGQLGQLDTQISALTDTIDSTIGKIEDLRLLEQQLEDEILLAEQAKLARHMLVPITPVRCPSCGLPLGEVEKGDCPCCNRPTPTTELNYDAHILTLRGRHTDTKAIRKRFEVRVAESQADLQRVQLIRKNTAQKIHRHLAEYLTPLTAELSDVSERIGALERQLDELRAVSSDYHRLNNWRNELDIIEGTVTELEHSRDVAQLMVARRFDSFDANLKNFLTPEIYPGVVHAEMDRKRLEPKLDGKFIEQITSASDKVVARLAYYIAWLLTSLQGLAIYPRFVMIDTPQDKGLDRPRVEEIVGYLADLSLVSECDHQIILTTGVVPDGVDRFIRARLNKKRGVFLLKPSQLNG